MVLVNLPMYVCVCVCHVPWAAYHVSTHTVADTSVCLPAGLVSWQLLSSSCSSRSTSIEG